MTNAEVSERADETNVSASCWQKAKLNIVEPQQMQRGRMLLPDRLFPRTPSG
jgi:hypothetical protein